MEFETFQNLVRQWHKLQPSGYTQNIQAYYTKADSDKILFSLRAAEGFPEILRYYRIINDKSKYYGETWEQYENYPIPFTNEDLSLLYDNTGIFKKNDEITVLDAVEYLEDYYGRNELVPKSLNSTSDELLKRILKRMESCPIELKEKVIDKFKSELLINTQNVIDFAVEERLIKLQSQRELDNRKATVIKENYKIIWLSHKKSYLESIGRELVGDTEQLENDQHFADIEIGNLWSLIEGVAYRKAFEGSYSELQSSGKTTAQKKQPLEESSSADKKSSLYEKGNGVKPPVDYDKLDAN